MTDTFISEKNKALVWQLLMDAKAFINIPDLYTSRVISSYEKIIQETSSLQNLTLTEKNKLVLQKMSQFLSNVQSQIQSKTELSSETIAPPLKEVKLKIDNDFANKKEEFFKLVNHNKPDDLSFNDDLDQPFGEKELDNKLNNLLQTRNYDIQKSFPDKPIDTSNNITVKFATPLITQPTTEQVKEGENNKIAPPSANQLLSKLKKINISDSTSNKSELQTIITQQSEIITLLTSLLNKLN